jgi:hypothetical protein
VSEAQIRRFPPVAGPFGWGGAVFIAAAFVSDMVGALFMVLLVANRDGRFVLPLIVAFFLTFPLLAVAMVLWLIGSKRAGTFRPSSMPKDRQRELLTTMAALNLVALAGIGTFVYLALRLDGTRRFVFALVPIFVAMAGMQLCLRRMQQLRNRPAPWFLGPWPKRGTMVFVALSLICAALLLLTGFFWTPT